MSADRDPLQRARRNLWRSPAYRGLRHAAGRVVDPLFRAADVYLIFRFDLTRPVLDYPVRAPVVIEEASPETAEEAARLERPGDEGDRQARRYRDRLSSGARCFVARSEGQVVAYDWMASGRIVDNGHGIELREDEIYGLDAYTATEWRGRAIHTGLLAAMLRSAAADGYRMAYTEVSLAHRRSWKTHRRLGWSVSGVVLETGGTSGRRRLRLLRGSLHPIVGLALPSAPDEGADR